MGIASEISSLLDMMVVLVRAEGHPNIAQSRNKACGLLTYRTVGRATRRNEAGT